jgi:hypothetical protein
VNFTQAIEQLEKGEFIARAGWKEEGKYIVHMPGMTSLWMIMQRPAPNAGNWLPLVQDFVSQDWELVDRSHEQPSEAANPSAAPAEDAALAA